jgi:hypothetical protein
MKNKEIHIVDVENLNDPKIQIKKGDITHLHLFNNKEYAPNWSNDFLQVISKVRLFKYHLIDVPRWTFNNSNGVMKEYLDKQIHAFVRSIDKKLSNDVEITIHSKDTGFLTLMEEFPFRLFKFPLITIKPTIEIQNIKDWLVKNQQKIKEAEDVLSFKELEGLSVKEKGILTMLSGKRRPALGSRVINIDNYTNVNPSLTLVCLLLYIKQGYQLTTNELIKNSKETVTEVEDYDRKKFTNPLLVEAFTYLFKKYEHRPPKNLKAALNYVKLKNSAIIKNFIQHNPSWKRWFITKSTLKELKLICTDGITKEQFYTKVGNNPKLKDQEKISLYRTAMLRGLIK